MASYAKISKITFDRGITIASITLDIRVEDMDIIKQFGPAIVNFGGTIEYTISYDLARQYNLVEDLSDPGPVPAEVTLEYTRPDNELSIVDDLKVTYKFSLQDTEIGNAVALAWQNAKVLAVQEEINRIRAIDTTSADESIIEI